MSIVTVGDLCLVETRRGNEIFLRAMNFILN